MTGERSEPARIAELVRWEVTVTCLQPGVRGDKDSLKKLLAQGWEPFAVTWDGDAWDYHLRRRTDGD